MKRNETSWNGVAEWYDDLLETSPDSYQAKVILPNLLRIIDPKPGTKVIDIACGQGYFSRAFCEKGAEVIGCDISPKLIAIANKHNEHNDKHNESGEVPVSIKYFVSSSEDLSFAKDGSADVCVIVLAIQNIEKMSETFAEVSRVLKQGGRFVLVVNHPAFRIPGRSSWQWEEGEKDGRAQSSEVQYRRIDAYMSESRSEIDMHPGEQKGEKTISFHRPLQVYFKSLSKNGFKVARLEEWISHKKSQSGPRSKEEDRMRSEIPLFMMIEAVK